MNLDLFWSEPKIDEELKFDAKNLVVRFMTSVQAKSRTEAKESVASVKRPGL